MRLILGLVLSGAGVFGQLAHPPPSPRNLNDIVQRLAIGDVSLVGIVAKQELGASGQETGVLYTIRVERVLCGAADFQAGADSRDAVPNEVHVFKPLAEGMRTDDPWPVEQFYIGGKYLLILKKDSQAETLIEKFGLDPKLSYFRAVGGERGAVQLEVGSYAPPEFYEMGFLNNPMPGFTPPKMKNPVTKSSIPNYDGETRALLGEAIAVCEAVKPTSMEEKERALGRLDTANARLALRMMRGEALK